MKSMKTMYYLIGSVVLSVVAIISIPKVLFYSSGAIYKKSVKLSNAKQDNNDWGPVIEKKKK